MSATLHLDVVIDVVCPWCFVGKRQLDAAMAAAPEIGFTVRYRAFQLDPTIPAGGMDRTQYMLAKFRDQTRIDEAHARLAGMGRPLGIDFRFERIAVAPNTFDAHRVIRFAAAAGKGEPMVERLFTAFFTEGADLSRPETLADAAASVGLDRDAVRSDLASGRERAGVEEDLAAAARLGITGVPCTIVASTYAISGARPAEALTEAFREIAAGTAGG